MENDLTDRQFWIQYWESKTNLVRLIKKNHTFSPILKGLCQDYNVNSALEIGGFPGYYSIFLKKFCNVEKNALMDYFIHEKISIEIIQKNGLLPLDIELIEANIFTVEPKFKYDLVMSCGLIEHFNDTKQIIASHLPHLGEKGVLFITLPNFKGLNGWFQRKFDMSNYEKHNINCMDIDLLNQVMKELNLKNISVKYYGTFSIWLEDISSKSILVKIFLNSTWFLGKIVSKILPFESKLFSPYIVLVGKKW